jgi:hypothetical protein
MQIALYSDHHHLPFWRGPRNPERLFDPNALEGWTYRKREWDDATGDYKKGPVLEHFVMPVLNGLLALHMPGIMAHVSLIFKDDEKLVVTPKRVWVQITTEPAEKDDRGLPIVVKNGIVQVLHLWGGDNGTSTPYGFLDKHPTKEEDTPQFWTNFFLGELRESKQKAHEEAEEARARAQRFALIIP